MSEHAPPKPTILHRLEFILFQGMERLLAGLSLADASRLGSFAGRVFHIISPRYRRLVTRNIRIATANNGLSPDQVQDLVVEVFQKAGANMIAALRTPTLDIDALHESTIAEGVEFFENRGEGRRGGILTMAHMGNWEAAARLAKAYVGDAPFGAVYRPLGNPLLDELTQKRRTMEGGQMFSRKDGFHATAALLRDGGVLGVLADQRSGARGAVLPFFGKLTTCSPLPSLLAKRGRADVGVLTFETVEPGLWRFVVRTVDGEPEVSRIMAELETSMRMSLGDVFWFHDRWKVDKRQPLTLFSAIDEEQAAAASVPCRILLSFPEFAGSADRKGIVDHLLTVRPDLRIEVLGDAPDLDDDKRVAIHPWDHSRPAEHADSDLSRVDESHPAPLDAAILFGSEIAIAKAARRAGLRAIIGLNVSGKPWSRSFSTPHERSGLLEIIDELAWVPPRFRK